jgi:hypothetical protein
MENLNREQMLDRLLKVQSEIDAAYAALQAMEDEKAALRKALVSGESIAESQPSPARRKVKPHFRDKKSLERTYAYIKELIQQEPRRTMVTSDEIARNFGVTRDCAGMRLATIAARYPEEKFQYKSGPPYGRRIEFDPGVMRQLELNGAKP